MKVKDKNNAAIGERIKEIRLKRNITQEALAEKVNLGSAQQVSDIERGLCGLSVAKLVEFCKALDVDADYLLFGTATRVASSVKSLRLILRLSLTLFLLNSAHG